LEKSNKSKDIRISNIEKKILSISSELSEKINQSETRQKELKFYELRNQELNKKMEKFEFLIKEKESFLLMYKNSQKKVNQLENENIEIKKKSKEWFSKFHTLVDFVYENGDSKIHEHISTMMLGKKDEDFEEK
jgi:hypothetical protein